MEKKEKKKNIKAARLRGKTERMKGKKINTQEKICIKNMNFCEKKKERRKINFCCMFHTYFPMFKLNPREHTQEN